MANHGFKRPKSAILAPATGLFLLLSGTAFAQYSSTNYSANEIQFGAGGGYGSSANYQSQQSLGSLGVGKYSSPSYNSYPGPITPEMPYLEFVVNSANIDLGVLSTSKPSTTTGTFEVKTYLSDGYVVTNASPGPKDSSYTIHTLSSPTTSSIGNEQFGINLVANNNCPQSGMPASLGSDPVQVPDNTFSFGSVSSNYGQACKFIYNDGDVVAQSNQSTGETDFTISYLYNISSVTPGGVYTFNHILVATSTF